MKVNALFGISIGLMLFSCTNKLSKNAENTASNNDTALIGGDKDAHNCIGSAGYTWSVILKKCVRLWETGLPLKPILKNKDAEFTATIIFSDDKEEAELFIKDEKESIILKAQSTSKPKTYQAHQYQLIQNTNGWRLLHQQKEIYRNF